MELIDLKGLTFDATVALAMSHGQSRFRGEQLYRWVHRTRVSTFEEMTNLPAAFREELATVARLTKLEVDLVQTSRDGTRKLRLRTADGKMIESVLIPDGDKTTQCISSQVGCALDCQFCATGTLKLSRHLDAGEIVDQIYRGRQLLDEVDPDRRITNIVYMGMGEPLHNYDNVVRSLEILTSPQGSNFSPRRITVSTVGLVPKIQQLGNEKVRPNLAVSLNASSDVVRDEIMPVNKKWNIAELLGAIRAYPLERRRRVTFEYVMLAGKNDTMADAARLAKLLRGIPCKLNIIPWNPHPGAAYRRPTDEAIHAFQTELKRLGLPTYLRISRGDDIDAACGQLANRGDAPAKPANALPVVL